MPDRTLYAMHALICQTLANPKRLEIIDTLREGERSVGDLAEALEVSQSNVSQHLAVMRLGVEARGAAAEELFARQKLLVDFQAGDQADRFVVEGFEHRGSFLAQV